MKAGPLSARIVAVLLGKKEHDIPALVESEGLPAFVVNSATQPVYKVYPSALLAWINASARNVVVTKEQFDEEIGRAIEEVKARDQKTRARKKARKERALAAA